MKKLIWAFLCDEEGQTSTEYILLLAVVAMIVFKFKGKAEEGLGKVTDTIFGKANNIAEQIGSN